MPGNAYEWIHLHKNAEFFSDFPKYLGQATF